MTTADTKGHWSVFFFYPADFTFVCPTELGDLADAYAELQSLGVEVYSVSTDTHFVHKAWHDASDTIKKITYPMIADPTGTLSRGFGVHIEEEALPCVAPSSPIPKATSRSLKFTTYITASPKNWCAKLKPPNGLLNTPGKSAQPNGKKAPKPQARVT